MKNTKIIANKQKTTKKKETQTEVHIQIKKEVISTRWDRHTQRRRLTDLNVVSNGGAIVCREVPGEAFSFLVPILILIHSFLDSFSPSPSSYSTFLHITLPLSPSSYIYLSVPKSM